MAETYTVDREYGIPLKEGESYVFAASAFAGNWGISEDLSHLFYSMRVSSGEKVIRSYTYPGLEEVATRAIHDISLEIDPDNIDRIISQNYSARIVGGLGNGIIVSSPYLGNDISLVHLSPTLEVISANVQNIQLDDQSIYSPTGVEIFHTPTGIKVVVNSGSQLPYVLTENLTPIVRFTNIANHGGFTDSSHTLSKHPTNPNLAIYVFENSLGGIGGSYEEQRIFCHLVDIRTGLSIQYGQTTNDELGFDSNYDGANKQFCTYNNIPYYTWRNHFLLKLDLSSLKFSTIVEAPAFFESVSTNESAVLGKTLNSGKLFYVTEGSLGLAYIIIDLDTEEFETFTDEPYWDNNFASSATAATTYDESLGALFSPAYFGQEGINSGINASGAGWLYLGLDEPEIDLGVQEIDFNPLPNLPPDFKLILRSSDITNTINGFVYIMKNVLQSYVDRDQASSLSKEFDLDGEKIINVGDPVLATDLANKRLLDQITANLKAQQ